MKVSGKAQFEGVDREFEIRLLGKGRRSAFATIIIGVISLVEHDFNEKKQFDQLKQGRDGFVSIKSSFDLV